jgi:hypothetical protein
MSFFSEKCIALQKIIVDRFIGSAVNGYNIYGICYNFKPSLEK